MPEPMRPGDVPDELVDGAVDAWHDAPRNEHGKIALDDHMRHILAAVLPTHKVMVLRDTTKDRWEQAVLDIAEQQTDAVMARKLPEIEKAIRAKVEAELMRAAKGRQHYADNCPPGPSKEHLEGEALAYTTAAHIAAGRGPELMWGLLPVFMWTDAERGGR